MLCLLELELSPSLELWKQENPTSNYYMLFLLQEIPRIFKKIIDGFVIHVT